MNPTLTRPSTHPPATRNRPVVDPEFRALFPPLSGEERGLLIESLLEEGCRDALAVWWNGERDVLLDGHNRLRICNRAEIPYRTTPVPCADREEAMAWILRTQIGRRNLCQLDRIAAARRLEPFLARQAAARRRSGKADPGKKPSQGRNPKTVEHAAAVAGVSHATYTAGKTVLAGGSPALIDAIRGNKVSISAGAVVAALPKASQDLLLPIGIAGITAEAAQFIARIPEVRLKIEVGVKGGWKRLARIGRGDYDDDGKRTVPGSDGCADSYLDEGFAALTSEVLAAMEKRPHPAVLLRTLKKVWESRPRDRQRLKETNDMLLDYRNAIDRVGPPLDGFLKDAEQKAAVAARRQRVRERLDDATEAAPAIVLV